MSAKAGNLDVAEADNTNVPATPKDDIDEKYVKDYKGDGQVSDSDDGILVGPNGEQYPSAEELQTLRRTHGPVPYLIYTIAFVELCERFAYYGTIVVCESTYYFSLSNALHHLTLTSQQLYQLAASRRIQDWICWYRWTGWRTGLWFPGCHWTYPA